MQRSEQESDSDLRRSSYRYMSLRKKPLDTVFQLEKIFKKSNQNPSREQKEKLILSTGLTSGQINKWFQNRRNRKVTSKREEKQLGKDGTKQQMYSATKMKIQNWNPKNGRYWTEEANLKLLRLIQTYGNNWTRISQEFPDRTLKQVQNKAY